MTSARHTRHGKVDLREVRRRLDRAIAATEAAMSLSPERAKAVMEERARTLARVPSPMTRAAEEVEVITFDLANECYGIETRFIREVVRFTEFTPIPDAPEFVVGVTVLRGEILTVIDLRRFLGVAGRGLTDLSRVVVLGEDRAEFGVLADAAHEVKRLMPCDVLEPPGSVAGVGREYVVGVTADAFIVLNGEVLLRDDRLFVDHDEGTDAHTRKKHP